MCVLASSVATVTALCGGQQCHLLALGCTCTLCTTSHPLCRCGITNKRQQVLTLLARKTDSACRNGTYCLTRIVVDHSKQHTCALLPGSFCLRTVCWFVSLSVVCLPVAAPANLAVLVFDEHYGQSRRVTGAPAHRVMLQTASDNLSRAGETVEDLSKYAENTWRSHLSVAIVVENKTPPNLMMEGRFATPTRNSHSVQKQSTKILSLLHVFPVTSGRQN